MILVAVWIHIFYLTKYYEFIDTLFLVLRKRNVGFLHVFHHSTYIIACWGASVSHLTLQWYMGALNSFIHVVMYSYYALVETPYDKIAKRFAKYITAMQMIQFLVGNFGLGLTWYAYRHYYGYSCSGGIEWGPLSTLLTFIYFYLFNQMRKKKYNAPVKKD